MEVSVGGRLVVNPGALLREPAEGWEGQVSALGTFGVLDLPAQSWRVYRARTGREVEVARRRA